MNELIGILDRLGASTADALILLVVMAQFGLFLWRDRSCKEATKDSEARSKDQLDKLERRMDSRFKSVGERQASTSDKLWAEVTGIKGKYHQLDKLTAMLAIAIQRKTGLKLIKQSADGQGDHALNRDVE